MALNPEDVPQVLVDDAVDAWHETAPALLDDELRAVLAAVLPTAFKLLAERIALVSDVKVGFRCPACHGKPSSSKAGVYRCGCGHSWDLLDTTYFRREVSIPVMLQQVAETGELPAVPAKIARGGDR